MPQIHVILALCLVVSACKKSQTETADQALSAKGGLLLKPVGSSRVNVDKNELVTLHLVATYVEVGPAANLDIDVDFTGTVAGDLRVGKYTTDAQGFVDIPYTAPNQENISVGIRCKANGAPIMAFTVNVAREIVTLDWTGRKPFLVKKDTDATMRVVATNQRGAPKSGVFVEVEIVGGSDYGAQFREYRTIATNASGVAEFTFASGTLLANYTLRARSYGVNDAQIEVVVADAIPEMSHCDFSSDCDSGFVCSDGTCVIGTRRCRTGHQEDCPLGYSCSDNICVDGCGGNVSCLPPQAELDVTGRWTTNYVFDLHEALGFLSGLHEPLDKLDTLVNGKLPGTIDNQALQAVLEAMLGGLMQALVPDWVPKLSTALNDLFGALSSMHIIGRLDLSLQENGSNVLRGEETLDAVEVQILSFCPHRMSDENYPRCAKVNVQLGGELGSMVTAKATAAPFVGTIFGKTVVFQHRQTSIELKKMVSMLVDLLVNIASNGRARNIDDSVKAIFDCPRATASAGQVSNDVTNNGIGVNPQRFNTMCQTLAPVLGQIMAGILDLVPITWDLPDYDAGAIAAKERGGMNVRADRLKDGTVLGNSNLGLGGPMTGTWQGER